MNIRFVNSDVERFIKGLGRDTFAKTLRTLDLLETFGYQLAAPHSKKIRHHLFELRVRGK